MKYIIIMIFPFILLAETTFITDMEYAAQFYKNPRGIGCQHCHGEKGEGKLIANYIHKGEKKSFWGPAINRLDLVTFFNELNERKRGMPRYYLTKKEIQALYLYLHKYDKKEVGNEK